MVRVKNVSTSDVMLKEGGRTHLVKRGEIAHVPLSYALRAMVNAGKVVLMDGVIMDFPGGIRHHKSEPKKLRSSDDDWNA